MSEANPYQGYHAQLLEKLERLERENAALREALRQIKKKADPTSWTHPVQKADAAYWIAEDTLKRKEAQP